MAVLNKVALQFKERFWPLDICGFNRVPMQQVGVGWPSNFGISGTVPSVQWRQRGLKKTDSEDGQRHNWFKLLK